MYRIKNLENTEVLRAELSQSADLYYSIHKPSTKILKKYGILKKLKGKKDLAITHQDKGNGVVTMNRKEYDKPMYDILEDNSKFKKVKKDPTLFKEGQLQHFIRTLKRQEIFDEDTYGNIYLA